MFDLLTDWANSTFRRDKVNPYPFGETTSVISSIIFAITGLIIFSYYAQSSSCMNYNDWRRTFTTIALIFVVVIIFMYSMVYIGAFMINYKTEARDEVEFKPYAIIGGIMTFVLITILPITLIGRAVDLTLKPKNDYDNLFDNHPLQYIIMLVVSGFLILGSTLPLMNYVGSKIINPPPVFSL